MRIDWEEKRVHRYLVIVTAFSFLFLTLAIISVYNEPMVGYEYSVYQSTPFIFWIAIIVGLIVGILVFIVNYGRNRVLCWIGLFEILLSHFILISLYLYRGFIYIQRSDSLTYIGYAKDIVIAGHVPGDNFYPMISITMASVGEVIGQSTVIISQILPSVFFTIYTLGILCWTKTISTQPRFVTSMMLASMPIFFAWFIPSIFHETLCILMLPFFFFILWKSSLGGPTFKILTAVMIIYFIGGHPMVAVGILIIIAVIYVTELISKKEVRIISFSLILFIFVILFGWIVNNALLVKDLQRVGEQLIGMVEGVSTFGSAQGQASSLGLLSSVQSVLVCTIDDIIYIFLAFWLGVTILRSKWKLHPMTTMMACFLGGSVFLGALVLFTFAHNPFRMINLNYIMIFSIPLVGYLLYILKGNGKVMLSRLVTVLILFCLISTVFTVYQDPIEMFPNGSVTKSEIVGSNWLITNLGDEITIHALQTLPWRYGGLIYNDRYLQENPDLLYNNSDTTAHFESFLNANSTKGIDYLVLTTLEIAAYTQTWLATNKFTINDFHALALSSSANHIYMSGCLTVYSRT